MNARHETQNPASQLPHVLVMAGGEGRRMGALTSTTPKPMLPIAGLPTVQHTLEQLRDQGLDHAFLSVCFNADVISDHFGNGESLGLTLDYVREETPLGTAGALGLLPALSRPLMIINGDLVTDIPFAALIQHHTVHSAAMTIATAKVGIPIPYGVIQRDGGEVAGVVEKPTAHVDVVAGIYVLSPEVLAARPARVHCDMPELISALIAEGQRVVHFALPGAWLDIGTPDVYESVRRCLEPPVNDTPQITTPGITQGITQLSDLVSPGTL